MEQHNEDVSDLENRHRKEKKDLQAHIQALKKAAKNDKTKKKEITAEIAKLELDLQIRHKEELESMQNKCDSSAEEKETHEDLVQELETEIGKVKLSKAQKRRDKRHLQEKQREEQIKQQEKENLHGPRNRENEAIVGKLKEKKLKMFSIPSDGDCLYKAVTHQLLVLRQTCTSVDELRSKVGRYIKENKDEFLPFMSTESGDMMSDDQFEEYCDKIIDTKVWGGQLEIRALSNLLKSPISVIQATGPESIEQGSDFPGPSLIITYHRHIFSLGEHYNSTEPLLSDIEEDA